MEGILKSRTPAVTLSTILEKKTSSAVPNRLVDKVIASLLLAGIVDHGLTVGEASVGAESDVAGDSTESMPDNAVRTEGTSQTMDMSTVDAALAAAVRATGVLAEVGRGREASPDVGETGRLPRNLSAPLSQVPQLASAVRRCGRANNTGVAPPRCSCVPLQQPLKPARSWRQRTSTRTMARSSQRTVTRPLSTSAGYGVIPARGSGTCQGRCWMRNVVCQPCRSRERHCRTGWHTCRCLQRLVTAGGVTRCIVILVGWLCVCVRVAALCG